jgi:hypothetical protein
MDLAHIDPAVLAQLPLVTPPPGHHSDFDAPAPDLNVLWVLPILTIVFAFLAVAVRIHTKLLIAKQKFSWDDGACVLALCAGIAHTYVIIKDTEYGLGKHLWNIRAISMTHKRLLSLTSANFIICINMTFVRISILALYQRLFGVYEMSKKLIIAGYGITVFLALAELSVVIGRMNLCTTPLAGITVKYCFTSSISIAVITFAITGLLLDVYIYSIAIFRLQMLQVTRHKKAQLIILFGFGLAALVFSLCNLIYVAVYFRTEDQLWLALWIATFKILEANIALVCACATFFPALWKAGKLTTSSFGSIFRTKSTNQSSEQSPSEKSSLPKSRESDEELVLSRSQELKPIIYTERERPAHENC